MARRKLTFTVWQPETDSIPWVVTCEEQPHTTKLDIVIYHSALKREHVTFRGMRLRNAREFTNFTVKMLQMCAQFNDSIEVRNQDLRALYKGYEEGVKRALNPDSMDRIRITERTNDGN